MAKPDAMFRVIQTDRATGWREYLDNMSASPWSDTFTREQADRTVKWRTEHITSKYGYEIVPVIPWRLLIGGATHHDLFMLVCFKGFGEDNPFEPAKVKVRDGVEPGGVVWAYTAPAARSAPGWLLKLRDFLAEAGYTAQISPGNECDPGRRP